MTDIVDGRLCKVLPRRYFRWPAAGGKMYSAGDLLRVPVDMATRLSAPADGSSPIVRIVNEQSGGTE